MTDTPQPGAATEEYRLAVERHLRDLPAAVRADLLADLEGHLAEVAADLGPDASLEDRLGDPASYARELREAAGLEPAAGPSGFPADAAAWLLGRADRYTLSAGAGSIREFAERLRPGWWVLRGVAAAVLVAYGIAGLAVSFPVFQDRTVLVAVVIALSLVFVWLSLRLAAAAPRWGTGRRVVVALGSVLMVLWGASAFAELPRVGHESGVVHEEYYDDVTDVYVFDENGEPIYGASLRDQHGAPLWIGDPGACPYGMAHQSDDEYGYRYPLCESGPEDAGPTSWDPTDNPTHDPTPDPTEEATVLDPEPTEEATSPGPEPTESVMPGEEGSTPVDEPTS